MGALREESRQELIFAFFQEMLGSLIMFLLFFPIETYLGDTYHGWIYHFIAVIVFDIITIGAAANPCVCLALLITGKMDETSTTVRVVGEIVAGFLAFPVMKLITPSALFERIEGPELALGVDTVKGAFAEMCLTYLFVLVALVAINYVTDPNISRPLFAVTLRILIILGGSITGASMNSMIGMSWAWYTNRLLSTNYNIVYTIAPNVGAMFASIAFMIIVMLTKRTKRVEATVSRPAKEQAVAAPKAAEPATSSVAVHDKVAAPVTPAAVRRRTKAATDAGSASRGRSQSRTRAQTPSSGGKKNGEGSARKGDRSASRSRARKPSSAKKTK